MFRTPDFSTLRKKNFTYRLFGEGTVHSKSPLTQNFLFAKLGLPNFKYESLDSLDVDNFVKLINSNGDAKTEAELVFNGSAVTMPHKVVMTQYVDVIDDNAKAVGAINTIYIRFDKTGKLLKIGTNTDTVGIRDSMQFNAPETVEASRKARAPGVVYGGGGACRSGVYALKEYLGCSKVYIINRFAHEVEVIAKLMAKNGFTGEIVHVQTPQQAAELEKPHLIVLTVPDFEAVTEEEKLARATLEVFIQQEEKGAVLEMCYHPKEITRLYTDFKNAGWNVIGGVEAMIYQGLAQQELWTGYPLSEMPVDEVVEYVHENLHKH